ncbi:MAG: DEAD/DEAH box helicase, partial [Candidatus Bathyarchaeia archaeon]
MLVFLQHSGLVVKDGNVLKSSLTAVRDVLLDDVLTFIEEKDALQIRYGIYDTAMVGADIFSGMRLSGDPYYIKLEYALRMLMKEKLLLPLNIGTDIRNWEFRSRIAEITRLLYKLRQRFYDHYSYRNSPKLTRSVKLEIVHRKFPQRNIQISSCISSLGDQLKSSKCWSEFAGSWNFLSSILVESLIKRGFEKVSDFQDRCFKKIFTHLADRQSEIKGLVITAGTGMGKTLSYIGPLLLYVLFEKSEKNLIGTKAICIYPRIKLAENQIEGFIKAIYEINRRLKPDQHKISIGIDYTGTPYRRTSFRNEPVNGNLFEGIDRLWIYDSSNDAYICPYARCPECGGELHIKRNSNFSMKVPLVCAKCGTSIDFVSYCKDDIAEDPPDIFITTTETLNARLTSAKFQSIFGTEEYCVPKLIMIDEIHLHTSLKGSQVALLIRRLLKRLSIGLQHSQQSAGEPIILGLSATTGHPEEFFSELTGIPQHLIEIEGPTEDEFEKSGVEYFIFIKPEIGENIAVLSNLIQTCMCVLHNMPQPIEFPKRNHKALGFVDSLDIVRRWTHDLKDAEKEEEPLYRLRDPDLINSVTWIKNYFGSSTTNCKNCSEIVDKTCIHFKEGECWWFLRFGKSQDDPLRVQYKTAGDGFVPLTYDLVVTTSAMEVGYDDPDIMCIIQYLSPMNIASFTQRKGRAGRDVLNRPISVAVLSPYRTKDVYYYRNHHILIEPSFEKLPLNVDNKAIRKIHGFYTILDFLAFENRTQNIDFPAYLSKDDIIKLERASQHRKEIEKYIKGVLGYNLEKNELEEIWSLFEELINRLEDKKLTPSDILSEHLPKNLFSSINLPTVDI